MVVNAADDGAAACGDVYLFHKHHSSVVVVVIGCLRCFPLILLQVYVIVICQHSIHHAYLTLLVRNTHQRFPVTIFV